MFYLLRYFNKALKQLCLENRSKAYWQNLEYENPSSVKFLGSAVFGDGDGNMTEILREYHDQTCRPVESRQTLL